MAYGKITDKQREILEYIKNEILNRGFPPAVREICEADEPEVHVFCSCTPGESGKEWLYPT